MIDFTDHDDVRVIELNDPGSFNAISESLVAALREVLDDAVDNSHTRAVILTSSGKLFSAGGNLKNFMAQDEPMDEYINKAMETVYNPFGRFLRNFPLPMICAVNGPAIGAGVGLALSCDIVLAAKSAYFSLPFVPKLGVVPDMGSSWLISQSLSYQQALALTLTGEPFSAEDAAKSGMIWRCCDDDQVRESALTIAKQLAKTSPAAIRRSRQLLRAASRNMYSEQLELERELQTESFGGRAFQEGLSAFAERREPDFVSHGDE